MAGISDKEVRSLIAKAKIAGRTMTQADGLVPGLTLSASKNGTGSWLLRYRISGKAREFTIGQFPVWGAADAREKAKELRRAVDTGVDVAQEKKATKLARATEWTVDDLAINYFEKAEKELAPHTLGQRKSVYERFIKSQIGALPAVSVKPSHVVEVVRKSLAGGKTLPRLVLIIVTQFYHHAVGRAVCQSNPCRDIKETAIVGKAAPPRQRISLSAEELAQFLPALANIPRQYQLAIRLMLLTGVRVGTMVEARVSEFDIESKMWNVPHERRKNRRHTTGPFAIPLPILAVEWVQELIAIADGDEYMLPVEARRHTDTRNPLSKRTTVGDWLDRGLKLNSGGWRRITPHDLRSTCKSWLSELKVDYETRQRYLDHSLEGMDAIYDKSDLIVGRLAAAEKWLGFLVNVESGKNATKVVPMKAVAA